MKDAKGFSVKFGKIGRTLDYEGVEGRMIFCFDLGSHAKAVELGRGALSGDHKKLLEPSPATRLAFERTKEYLESCGYEVEPHPANEETPNQAPEPTAPSGRGSS